MLEAWLTTSKPAKVDRLKKRIVLDNIAIYFKQKNHWADADRFMYCIFST